MTSIFRHVGLSLALAGGLALGASTLTARAEEVTIRYLASQGGISPHELADYLGYYKDAGIKLDRVGYAKGGPESLFALASGSVELGGAATPAVLNAIASGNDFVAAYPSNGVNATVKSTFYVLDDSPIHDIKDLPGKTIAINTLGAHLDYTVREAFHQAGLPETSANLVTVPGPQLEQTLRSKQVDVAAIGYWQQTFGGALLKTGGVRPIFTDQEVLGDIAGGYVVLRRDFIAAHSDTAAAFVAGAAKASDWADAHPDEARATLADILKSRGENPDIAQYWQGFGLRAGAATEPHDLTFWIDTLERGGKIPKGKLKVEDILFNPKVKTAAK